MYYMYVLVLQVVTSVEMSGIGEKRPVPQDVTDLEKVDSDGLASANVHAYVTSLSSLKKGRKSEYFDGTICDGKNTRRVAAFSTEQLQQMQEFKRTRKGAYIKDCQIKPGYRGCEMEVVLKRGSTIVGSTVLKKDSSSVHFIDDSSPLVLMKDVQDRRVYDTVTVQGKVVKVGKPHLVDENEKQDIVLVDSSCSGRVTLWGECVGAVSVGKSYCFKMFMVQEFGGRKYLTMRLKVLLILQLLLMSVIKTS